MAEDNEPFLHIQHSTLVQRELYTLYKKSVTRAIITKYSIFIFFIFLTFVLINAALTPGITFRKPLIDYLILLVFIAILTLVTTFLTVAFARILLAIKGKLLLQSGTQFSFFQDFLLIKRSNKEKIVRYNQLELVQENDGFDFFYPHSKGFNKIIAISKELVKDQEAYQAFLREVRNNKFRTNSLSRYLGVQTWGVSKGE